MRNQPFDQLNGQTRIRNVVVTDASCRTLWTPSDLTLENVDFTALKIGDSNSNGSAAKRTQLFLLLFFARYKNSVCITGEQAIQLYNLYGDCKNRQPYEISIGLERNDPSFEEYNTKLKNACTKNTLLSGVKITNSALTPLQLMMLHALGARKFSQIVIHVREQCPETLTPLSDAEFDDQCSVSFGHCYNSCQKFYINHADFQIPILSASSAVEDRSRGEFCPPPEVTANFLMLWTGKNKSALAALALSESKFVGQNYNASVLALLFDEQNTLLHRVYRTRTKTTFDLSEFQNRIGDNLYNQSRFVDALLSIDFGTDPFPQGILFPDFILNQCDHSDRETLSRQAMSVDALKSILVKVTGQLTLLQRQGFVSTHLNSRDISVAHGLTLQGCTIQDDFKLVTRPVKLSGFTMRHTTCERMIDFSNVTFEASTLSHTSFKKGIKINIATDFRQAGETIDWPDAMPIIFIDERGQELETTVSDFLTRLENKYYELRPGGRHGSSGRSDFFKDEVHKESHVKTQGEKLLFVLSHIQSKLTHFTQKLESRTYDALMAILPDLAAVTQEKRQAEIAEREAEERRVMLQKMQQAAIKESDAAAWQDPEVAAILQKRISKAHDVKKFFTSDGRFIREKLLACPIAELIEIGKQYRTITLVDTFSNDIVEPAIRQFTDELRTALATFHSPDVLGQDTHYDQRQCKLRSDELIAQYRFLKTIAGENTPFFEELKKLIHAIYIHFLKHVANREKVTDTNGNQSRWLRHDFLIQLFTESDISPEVNPLRVHAKERTLMRSAQATDAFFSSKTPSGVEYIRICRSAWIKTSVIEWEKSGCIHPDILEKVKSKLVTAYTADSTYAHQLLIAEYLKCGDIKKAVAEIHVLLSQNIPLNRVVTDAIKSLVDRAVREAEHICRKEDQALKEYVSNPENAPAFKALCAFNALYNDRELEEQIARIKEGIQVTLAIDNIVHEFATHDKKIRIHTLQAFLACERKSFVWFGQSLLFVSGLLGPNVVRFSDARIAVADQLIRLLSAAKTFDQYEGDKIGEKHVASTRAVIDSLCKVAALKENLSFLLHGIYAYKPFEKAIVNGKLKLNLQQDTKEITNSSVNHPKYVLACHLQDVLSGILETLKRVRDPYRIIDALSMLREEIERILSAFEAGGHLCRERNGTFHKLLSHDKPGEAQGLLQAFCAIEKNWKHDVELMFHVEDRTQQHALSL